MLNRDGRLIYWLVLSVVSSVIFAKWAKSIHVYLFATFAWLFIWVLITQSWEMMEQEPEDRAFTTGAAIIGFIVGVTFVWGDDKRHSIAW